MFLACALPVKNEAKTIATTIDSLVGCDAILVYDTGSTDGTLDVAREALARWRLVRGEIAPGEFVDYAQMRNAAHDVAVRTFDPTWILSMSADERLCGDPVELRTFLSSCEDDVALIEVRTPSGMIDFPRFLRARSKWRYEGVIHECPCDSENPTRAPTARAPGWIEYQPSDPARNIRRLRERDVPLLMKEVEDTVDPTRRARAILHLAGAQEALATEDGDLTVAVRSQTMASALGWYLLAAVEPSTPSEIRPQAIFRYVEVATALGIYLPHERLERLGVAAKLSPDAPEIAYSRAACFVDVATALPTNQRRRALEEGAAEARRAAQVARASVRDPAHPHDPRGLLWRPHLIEAMCEATLGSRAAATRAAAAGLAAGGPPEAFEEFK